MEEEIVEVSTLESLIIELEKIDAEEIDTSINLDSVVKLAKLVCSVGTVRQIYDLEGLSDKFLKCFEILTCSIESVAEYDSLVKILKVLHSNTELDYFKYRLGENEQTTTD